jgi:DNA repair exonuclease SbcCD ATPase subunit
MENGDYVNHYVEILTATMTDAVIRNISLQANAKISEKVLNDQSEMIENLNQQIKNSSQQFENLNSNKQQEIENLNNGKSQEIQNYLNTISNLNGEINKLKNDLVAVENIKHQVQHVDTFRNELVKERELHAETRTNFENQIETLKKQIEYLQLTPAKRKKIDEANVVIQPIVNEEIKDAGSF